jgi:hypothetical protein
VRQCSVYCINTQVDAVADVLEESTKRMKLALVGTDITIVLTRSDTRRPYVGRMGTMEFETFGELE